MHFDSIFHSSPFVLASLRLHVDVWMCCGMLSASFLRPWRLKVCRMDVAWQEALMMFSATKWIRAILMAGFHGSIGVIIGSFSLGLALERGQAKKLPVSCFMSLWLCDLRVVIMTSLPNIAEILEREECQWMSLQFFPNQFCCQFRYVLWLYCLDSSF